MSKKSNRDEIVRIVSQFDTNYYIRNEAREAMIEDIIAHVDDIISKKDIRIIELNNMILDADERPLWKIIKFRLSICINLFFIKFRGWF